GRWGAGERGPAAGGPPRAAGPGAPAAVRPAGPATERPPPPPAARLSTTSAPWSESDVARARAAAAEPLDLSLEPLDLRALLGATEGVPIDAQRIAAASEARVGVAEVLDDGRVLARQLDRTLELL